MDVIPLYLDISTSHHLSQWGMVSKKEGLPQRTRGSQVGAVAEKCQRIRKEYLPETPDRLHRSSCKSQQCWLPHQH
jgi:hypothetical protein